MLTVENFFKEVQPSKALKFDDWLLLVHLLCKTYGWTYQELVCQPIPFVFGLLEGLKLEKDLEAKAHKKAVGKKR
jgi:hypothetical protein